VASTPLKNMSKLGLLFPIYGKVKFMFQTINQLENPRTTTLHHYVLHTHTACCDVARFGFAQRLDRKNSALVRAGCKSNTGSKPPIMEYLQGGASQL